MQTSMHVCDQRKVDIDKDVCINVEFERERGMGTKIYANDCCTSL